MPQSPVEYLARPKEQILTPWSLISSGEVLELRVPGRLDCCELVFIAC
jgi:hypothetical protein